MSTDLTHRLELLQNGPTDDLGFNILPTEKIWVGLRQHCGMAQCRSWVGRQRRSIGLARRKIHFVWAAAARVHESPVQAPWPLRVAARVGVGGGGGGCPAGEGGGSGDRVRGGGVRDAAAVLHAREEGRGREDELRGVAGRALRQQRPPLNTCVFVLGLFF